MDAESLKLIYAVVRRVPKGRVATYGQIAKLAGLPRHARHVGMALRNLPDGSRIPWHRIVNARGEISERLVRKSHGENLPDSETEQQWLLVDEGVDFDERGRIDLNEFQWRPRS